MNVNWKTPPVVKEPESNATESPMSLVTVWVVESVFSQVTVPPTATWKVAGLNGTAAEGASFTILTSADSPRVAGSRQMRADPTAPATRPPMTKPITARVRSPPVEWGLARYRFCARPVFALRSERIEKMTTRVSAGRPDIDSQNPESAGFEALPRRNEPKRTRSTRLETAASTYAQRF